MSDVATPDENGNFVLADGSLGNPGCDECGSADAIIRINGVYLCAQAIRPDHGPVSKALTEATNFEKMVTKPPVVSFSAKALREHFEGDQEMEPLLADLSDEELEDAAHDFLVGPTADALWADFHIWVCGIVREAHTDLVRNRTGEC